MANQKVREQKTEVITEVRDKLKSSAASIIADYRGLNVKQITELRKSLREEGIEFSVVKNTLARRATAEADLTELDEFLTGPTAIAFSQSDVIAPAKVLAKFAKGNDKLKLKAGIVEGKIVSSDDIRALADLPSREGLLSMLLSVLQAPMRNFALSVKAVAEKEESAK